MFRLIPNFRVLCRNAQKPSKPFSSQADDSVKLTENNFVTCRVFPRDFKPIIQLFWRSYAKDEPIMAGSGFGQNWNPVLEDNLVRALCQGFSLQTRCRNTGEILGAAINRVITSWDCAENMLADYCLCKSAANVIRIQGHIREKPDLFNKFCVQKIFQNCGLMVLRDFRRQGIASCLLKGSREDARDMGLKLMRIDCTSNAGAAVCDKLGFQHIWQMKYPEYKGPDGEQLIYPPYPTETVNVYVTFPTEDNCGCD